MMDTYTQPVTTKRQYRTLEQKQRIVGDALAEGASVARVARAHGVNANLVFNWCRLYRAGRLRRRSEAKLLPVSLHLWFNNKRAQFSFPSWFQTLRKLNYLGLGLIQFQLEALC